MRKVLLGPTTFHVSPSGSDVTGNGTAERPLATRSGAYDKLLKGYDLSGHFVTIKIADGLYTDFFNAYGPLLGQLGGHDGVKFVGNVSNPENVVIKPDVGGCFGCFHNSAYSISGMTLDQSNSPADTLSVGQQGSVCIDPGIVFGPNLHPFNHITVTFNSFLIVRASYKIEARMVQRIATWANGASAMQVSDASGIKKHMGVVGQAPAGTYVESVSGNTVTCNQSLGGAQNNVETYFSTGAQDHVMASMNSSVYYDTDGVPGLISVTVNNWPCFVNTFAEAFDGGRINIEAIAFPGNGSANGKRFIVGPNGGGINTQSAGVSGGADYLPGSMAGSVRGNGVYV